MKGGFLNDKRGGGHLGGKADGAYSGRDSSGGGWSGSSNSKLTRTSAKEGILSDVIQDAVEVGWDEERGNIAIADRLWLPGQEIFQDEPIMIVDNENFPEDIAERLDEACLESTRSTAGTGGERQLVGTMLLPALQFLREDLTVRKKALAMFCPEGSDVPPGFEVGLRRSIAACVRKGFISSADIERMGQEHATKDGTEVLMRIVMVCHCNIFSMSDDWRKAALCTGGGLLSHSCLPNCNWHWREGKYTLVAAHRIAAGEELTQSYLHVERFAPKQVRRDALLTSKWMVCNCQRCREKERIRGMRCRGCGRGTIWLQEVGQPVEPCEECGMVQARCLDEMMWTEKGLRAEVDHVDENFATMGTQEELEGLLSECVEHMTSHWVLSRVHAMMKEFAKACLLWDVAAHFCKLRCDFMRDAFPVPNSAYAFELEDLADCLALCLDLHPSVVLPEAYMASLVQAHGPDLPRPLISVRGCSSTPPASKAQRDKVAHEAYAAYLSAGQQQAIVFGGKGHQGGGALRGKIQRVVKAMQEAQLSIPFGDLPDFGISSQGDSASVGGGVGHEDLEKLD